MRVEEKVGGGLQDRLAVDEDANEEVFQCLVGGVEELPEEFIESPDIRVDLVDAMGGARLGGG